MEKFPHIMTFRYITQVITYLNHLLLHENSISCEHGKLIFFHNFYLLDANYANSCHGFERILKVIS